MTDNNKDGTNTHSNIGKLVQIGKVDGSVTIQDTLEAFACCPVCNRNDEVKKVSAILANQTRSMQEVTIEKSSHQDSASNWHTSTQNIPFSGTQTSVLAMKLKAPVQPQAKGKPSWAWWLRYFVLFYTLSGFGVGILSCLMLPIAAFSGTVDLSTKDWIEYLALILASFLLGAIFIFPFVWLNKKYKKKNDSYNQEVKRVQEQEYPKWQRATER